MAESAPNADGPSKADQDFLAQGAANVAAAALRGMPVGGSVGQTALNVAAGARTRWASVSAGAWMALILVAFSGVVGKVAMPTLAAILIFAAVGALRPHEVQTVARAGTTPRVAVIATFVATLLLPVPVAVGVGVVISLLLQLNQEAVDLAVVELVENADGRYVEQPPPARLASHTTTVLDVYGSLFYAGSRTLQTLLPDPSGAERCAVVLRLRGRTTLGATFFAVASQYAERLEAGGGRLYLTGLDPRLADRLRNADGKSSLVGAARLYEARPVLGDSTHAAVADATTWILAAPEQPRSSADGGDSS